MLSAPVRRGMRRYEDLAGNRPILGGDDVCSPVMAAARNRSVHSAADRDWRLMAVPSCHSAGQRI